MTELNYEPLFARVLLEREKKDKIGSIYVPETSQTKYTPEIGKVLKVGPTADDSVKSLVGKTVYFAKFAGAWIKIDDSEYYICQDEDILLGEAA